MKLTKMMVVVAMLVGSVAQAQETDAKTAYAEMKNVFGLVPSFMKAFPEEAIGPAWDEFKSLQLNPNTALPGKVKELIGLAVAAQIPCRYCIYFHTQAARLNGASDRELKEAIVMSAIVRHWSTVLNGNQIDEAAFKLEVGKILEYAGKPHAPPASNDAEKDIEATLGRVPGFLKAFPPAALPGAWRELKTVQLGKTALPNKYKELIGLAVASQIPCRYCTYFHTQTARALGATDAEIREAIGMASIVRHWSTFLNGMMTDETAFRREVDQAVAHIKKQSKVAAR